MQIQQNSCLHLRPVISQLIIFSTWIVDHVQLTCHVVATTILLDIGTASFPRTFFGRSFNGSLCLFFFITFLAPTFSVIVILACFPFMPWFLMANTLLESTGRTSKNRVTRGVNLT